MLLRYVVFLTTSAAAQAAVPPSHIVSQVRMELAAGDLNAARRELKQFHSAAGATPEYIEALSWLGRGELAAKQYAPAGETAAQVRQLCLATLGKRRPDAHPSLAAALGASIEVQALAAVGEGRRDQAVVFLREEVARWRDTSIRARIQKNLNLLTLEGKPAPPLEVARFVSGPAPRPLAAHRGHPVLLFFWAHWCSDCKQQVAIVERLQKIYGKRGLEVVAPTQHYGYTAGGEDASPAVETRYIQAVFAHYYAGLGPVETPLSEENFARYGVSTTPTLVLVDGNGMVQIYNPGMMSFEKLAAKIESLIQ